MTQKREFIVQNTVINVVTNLNSDYISLTDLVKVHANVFTLAQWLQHADTIAFLGMWEHICTPELNAPAFDVLTPPATVAGIKDWAQKTAAKGLMGKGGRYSGIYAHQDIAFEFAGRISPVFKLQVVSAFQRLKETENNNRQSEWTFRRTLAATNYRIHTDAVKEKLASSGEDDIYSEEAELINTALFGQTAREWREQAPNKALCKNIRDTANTHQLIVLSNLESINALLIRRGIDKNERLGMMCETAASQLDSLQRSHNEPPAVNNPGRQKKES